MKNHRTMIFQLIAKINNKREKGKDRISAPDKAS